MSRKERQRGKTEDLDSLEKVALLQIKEELENKLEQGKIKKMNEQKKFEQEMYDPDSPPKPTLSSPSCFALIGDICQKFFSKLF